MFESIKAGSFVPGYPGWQLAVQCALNDDLFGVSVMGRLFDQQGNSSNRDLTSTATLRDTLRIYELTEF
jgi:hypothetical protein